MLCQSLLYSKVTHLYNIDIFNILFHYDLSQDIEYSPLCYTVGLCCLSRSIFEVCFLKSCSVYVAVACNLGSIGRTGKRNTCGALRWIEEEALEYGRLKLCQVTKLQPQARLLRHDFPAVPIGLLPSRESCPHHRSGWIRTLLVARLLITVEAGSQRVVCRLCCAKWL